MFHSFGNNGFVPNNFAEFNEFKESWDEGAKNMTEKLVPAVKQAQEWNPYVIMGGTTAAISGTDFVVLASDTRMSQYDVNIMTRECEKVHVLSDKIILATCGFYGDVLEMKRLMQWRLNHYKFTYQHSMTVDMFATMLSRALYNRRFFPYYTGSILAGLTDEGKGAVYSYDPVGTIKRVNCECSGQGAQILQSFFDVKIDECTLEEGKRMKQPLKLEKAKMLMRDAFRVVAEREATTGDSIKLVWLKHGDKEPQQEVVPLRED